MSNNPKNTSSPVKINEKSEPDHEGVAMIKHGITRELKYTYFCRGYKYDSLEHAIAQAKRGQGQNT